jgi:hypothetical protein
MVNGPQATAATSNFKQLQTLNVRLQKMTVFECVGQKPVQLQRVAEAFGLSEKACSRHGPTAINSPALKHWAIDSA